MEHRRWNMGRTMCAVCAGIVIISYPLSIWCHIRAGSALEEAALAAASGAVRGTKGWALWNGASKAAMCAYLAFYILIPLFLRKLTAPEYKAAAAAKACLFDLGIGCISFLLGLAFLYQIDFVGVYYLPLVYETAATVLLYLMLLVQDKVSAGRNG